MQIRRTKQDNGYVITGEPAEITTLREELDAARVNYHYDSVHRQGEPLTVMDAAFQREGVDTAKAAAIESALALNVTQETGQFLTGLQNAAHRLFSNLSFRH